MKKEQLIHFKVEHSKKIIPIMQSKLGFCMCDCNVKLDGDVVTYRFKATDKTFRSIVDAVMNLK